MSHIATAIVRTPSGWVGDELDLVEVEDLDAVLDLLRQVGDDTDTTRLLFVEQDDEWFCIVRLEGDGDPRVFLSDGRAVEESSVAAMLYEAAEEVVDEEPAADDEEEETIRPAGEPVGDSDLLSDLGTPGDQLLELTAEEGMLPADVIAAVCENAGCLEQLEELREG